MLEKMSKTSGISEVVKQMENHLQNELLIKDDTVSQKQLWENTFIKKQIDKRERNECFTIDDHIRAMVYSMLSSGISWKRVEKDTDIKTGKIDSVDNLFYQYDIEAIVKKTPEYFTEKISGLGFASQYTAKQMKALLDKNIPKLMNYENTYGSVDNYYKSYIKKDKTCKVLVKALSDSGSEDKMTQLGFALACEYLRNVGYDIPKPDRHICRILGKDYLALSTKQPAPEDEAFDIVIKLADESGKSIAETDYILWSYCANGYGEICTKDRSKSECEECVAKEYCSNNK